mgnify:CR=1 FL=1
MTKQCKNCYVIKPLTEFPYNEQMKENYENACNECKTKQIRAWQDKNTDRIREHRRAFDKKVSSGERPHRHEAKKMRIRNYHVITRIINSHGIGKKLNVQEDTFIKNFGCSSKVFIARFENFFKQKPGMGWHNYGAWQMDHIKPIKEFALDTEASRKLCNHYTNLRPEWATTNMKKGAKYAVEQKI